MQGKRLLHALRLTNFLSYGPESEAVELEPLNVLIGPNGSGKSNLIEAISLLKAAPTDIAVPIRTGGGMREWIWKGEQEEESSFSTEGSTPVDLKIETTASYPAGTMPLRYKLQLGCARYQLELVDEAIENECKAHSHHEDVYFFYRYQDGHPVLNVRQEAEAEAGSGTGRDKRDLQREDIDLNKSILSQRKDPDQYPELTYLGKVFSEIALFRIMDLGFRSVVRGPQAADESSSFLREDGSNFGMVLNDLLSRPPTKRQLLEKLGEFYEHVDDITTRVHAGTVETLFHERGFRESTPSIRLSDGTLRYLCLLTILCHPSPPPLVCIEEPEIGLHPDALPLVANLLVKASERTQLVVTTHSDILVSALTEVPEAVVVCERDDDGSHLSRLDADRLQEWLKKYTLGELWISGEIGGNS